MWGITISPDLLPLEGICKREQMNAMEMYIRNRRQCKPYVKLTQRNVFRRDNTTKYKVLPMSFNSSGNRMTDQVLNFREEFG